MLEIPRGDKTKSEIFNMLLQKVIRQEKSEREMRAEKRNYQWINAAIVARDMQQHSVSTRD